MSLHLFKYIQRLVTPVPVNAPIAAGDTVDEALNKLQGQISAGTQEVFIGAPAILPTYPALIFTERTIGGQTVYEMQVNVP